MSYYSQENHGPYHLFDLGAFPLAGGGKIADCQLAYATAGTLNAAKDNAVLVTSWWSGTGKIMEQVYTGPGRALDPAKYFIIFASQLGSGIGSSPNTAHAPLAQSKFPTLRIEDDVAAQHRLVSGLFGIKKLALVFGGSMGAQQTYEWAVRHPDMVARAAPLAGTARTSDHSRLFCDTLIEAMTGDPAFKGGDYAAAADVAAGLRRVAGLMAVSGWCDEFYRAALWRTLDFASADDFKTNFMHGYFGPMDPNVLICKARKWQAHDVSRPYGGELAAALGRIKAKVMILPIKNDLMFPTPRCEDDRKMIAGAQLSVIESRCGHLGLFAIEPDYSPQIDAALGAVLAA